MLGRIQEALRGIGEKILERKSYTVLVCCFSFLSGVVIHSFFDAGIGFFWIYNLLLVSGVGILIYWRPTSLKLRGASDNKIGLIILILFFCLLGFARFNFSVLKDDYKNFFNREMEITGTIVEEPINKIDKQQLVAAPEEIAGEKFSGRTRILITAGLYPKYLYGQKIKFSCKLLEPPVFSDFDYAKYLSIQNIGAQCFRPDIIVIPAQAGIQADGSRIPTSLKLRGAGKSGMTLWEKGMTPWGMVMKQILRAKNFLVEKINLSLHEPFASFLGGLLLGARNSIPKDLSQNFKNTGTAHIVAISGWNITFLANLFMPALFILRVRRQKAFYLMSAAIFIYALFTGFSPSVFRAAIMGSTALYAQKSGRLNSAGRGLLYAITLMFLINPRLIYDAGFWLSACATFGLIYFSGIVQNIFHKIPKGIMRENLATTISAIIFTLPVSLYIFGTVSLWALPVNLIILPFVAAAIPLSLPAVLVSALPHGIIFAQILFLPAAAIMNFIVRVIDFFGSLHFGIWQVRISFWLMLAIYLALVIFVIKKIKKQNERF